MAVRLGHERLQRRRHDRQPEARHRGQLRGPSRGGAHDEPRLDRPALGADPAGDAVDDVDPRHRCLLRGRARLCGAALRRVPPHDRVVAREGPRGWNDAPTTGSSPPPVRSTSGFIRCDLLRRQDVRLHAVGAVQQRLVALHLQRVVRVAEVELALRREQQVEVELRGQRAPDREARLVQRHGLGRVVVGAHHLRVAPRSAAPDVVALEDGDVRDAVVRREVVREREPVHPAADDDDVVARREVAPLEERPVAEQPRHAGTSAARGRPRLARDARAGARATCAGTRSRRPSVSRDDLRADVRRRRPGRSPSGVGTSKPDRYDNASSASLADKRPGSPSRRRRRGRWRRRRSPAIASSSSRRTSATTAGATTTSTSSGASRRCGRRAGGHEPVHGGGLAPRRRCTPTRAVAELKHAAAPPRGRRTGSATTDAVTSPACGVLGEHAVDRRGPSRVRSAPPAASDTRARGDRARRWRRRPRAGAPRCGGRRSAGRPAAFERNAAIRSSARLADERRLVHRDRPPQPELGGMVVGQRVLAQVDVALLQPEHVQGVQAVRADSQIPARVHQRVPQLDAPRARVVQLERQLAHEARADRRGTGRRRR